MYLVAQNEMKIVYFFVPCGQFWASDLNSICLLYQIAKTETISDTNILKRNICGASS